MKKITMMMVLVIASMSLFTINAMAQDLPIVYVTVDGTGDGSSWDNAMGDLQEAINLHDSAEVWVAEGTYTPTQFPPYTDDRYLDDDRNKSIYIINDVSLYGGFAGTETERSQRDWKKNPTILDGENDFYIVVQMRGENSQDEEIEFGIDSTTVFDGFTITGGLNSENRGGNKNGAGMTISYADPQIKNCTFTKNYTFDESSGGGYGGAMKLFGSHARITSCVFDTNAAFYGAAIYMHGVNSPVIEFCTFKNNNSSTSGEGGAIYLEGFDSDLQTHLTVRNSKFINNQASISSAIHVGTYTEVTLLNNVFYGNRSAANYGAITVIGSSEESAIMNNSFSGNTAGDIGFGYDYAGAVFLSELASDIVFSNNILWGNYVYNEDTEETTLKEIHIDGSNPSNLKYNIIRGHDETNSNLNVDPGFLDDELHIDFNSPAIDAGSLFYYDRENIADTLYDADGNKRILNGAIDIGAYERTPFSADENGIIYVDAVDGSAGGSGSSWEHATSNLAIALEQSEGAEQIWVADGMYYTFKLKSDVVGGTDDSDSDESNPSLRLRNGLSLIGGFEGGESPDYDLSNRDLEANESIITGTLMVDGDSLNYTNTLFINANEDLTTIDSTAVIDGFILENAGGDGIKNGESFNTGRDKVEGSPIISNCTFRNNKGWGIYNYRSAAKIEKSVFVNNASGENYPDRRGGGGIYNANSGEHGEEFDLDPIEIIDCEFRNNNTGVIASSYGPRIIGSTFEGHDNSAVYFDRPITVYQTATSEEGEIIDSEFYDNSLGINIRRMSPKIMGCHFEGHDSKAISNNFVKEAAETMESSKPVTISGCMFQDNSTDIFSSFSKVTVANSVFNETQESVLESRSTLIDLVNSTVVNLEDIESFPISNYSSEYRDSDTTAVLTISNSIFWNLRMTTRQYIEDDELIEVEVPFLFTWSALIDTSNITHSVIEGGDAEMFYGEGMMFEDPQFTSEVSFSLQEDSPCIDAGNDDSYRDLLAIEMDFAGNGRMNGTIDMGALEYHKGLAIEDGEVENEIPGGYQLKAAYPNPFNPTTNIAFDLPESGFVTLQVFNLLGQEVATLVSEQMSAGSHTIPFAAHGLSSGIYLYRLQVNDFISQKQVTLVK